MGRNFVAGLTLRFSSLSHLRFLERSMGNSSTAQVQDGCERRVYVEGQMMHLVALSALVAFVATLGILFFWPRVIVIAAICLLLIFCLPAIRSQSRKREEELLAEYAPLLLNTAANLKTGLSALTALTDASCLLPKKSRLREAIKGLIADLRQGMPIETAMSSFLPKMNCPEVSLFRLLLPVALEHGGRFAPSLERLARLCEERRIMIEESRSSTANMRFTAAVLLGTAPLFLLLLSIRDPDFWDVMLTHSLAGNLATAGMIVITVSYLVLRQMADFRP
ncbi:MAG: type II secretion system F family protein [bacterium]|nr:type II secretion system F family protein [bacterium]